LQIKIQITLLLLLTLFQFISAQPTELPIGQTNIKFDQIGLEQGLSQSTVYAITQDAQGFMWFGTDDGLNRYDGYSINIFKYNPIDSNTVADNTVLSLLGNNTGDLWIGTRRGGVDRYVISENKFYHYKYSRVDSSTISDNSISSIYEDSNGNLWLGTKKGLNIYNKNSDSFYRIYFHLADTLSSYGIPVISIHEDKYQTLWIGTPQGIFALPQDNYKQIVRYVDTNSFKTSSAYHLKIQSMNLPGMYIRAIHSDKSGSLWVGTFGTGLKKFERESDSYINIPDNSVSSSGPIMGKFISSIYEDTRQYLWIATYDSGLYVFDRQSNRYKRQLDDPVMTMYEDKSGILWVGTYTSGMKFYDPRANRFIHYSEEIINENDKGNNLITSILEASDGKLWVGTYNNGVKIYSTSRENNIQRKKISTLRNTLQNSNSISSDKVITMCESGDGSIWIGTETDGLNRFDKNTGYFIRYKNDVNNINSISSNQITSLYYDNEEKLIWIGFLNGKIDSYEPSLNKFKHYTAKTDTNILITINSITTIYRGKQTGLWAGTFEGELNHFNSDINSFDRINFKPAIGTGTVKNGVYSLYEDDEGILWIGTYGGGLSRFDMSSDSIKTYTEIDGLSNNVVYGILPDKSGNLWLSTNKGISRFDPKNETFKVYDARDGLQSNEFNQGAYFGSSKGELFFGGVNGFNAFFPAEIEENNYIPPVYITSFKVFDKILPLSYAITSTSEPIELSYSDNFFSFEFTALNYTAPEKNKYAYMLTGFDKEWHKSTASQRYASYTNLDPGNYVLKVIGSNNDGVWNDKGTSVIIIIHPPFWMTWWFRGIIIIFILIIVAATIRYFVRKKIKERTQIIERETALERERLRIARDMHDDLGARLTEIRYLTEIKQTNASDYNDTVLKKVSVLTNDIISTFNEIVWSVSPQNDTLENLTEFIGQYAVDYLSKVNIRCRLDIPAQIPNIEAPAEIRHNVFLAVKEALNNAVKYSETHELHIKVEINNLIATITIQDFGKGFDASEKNKFGNGLKNMKSRMKNIGGNFQIEGNTGSGTKIILQFPVNKDLLIND